MTVIILLKRRNGKKKGTLPLQDAFFKNDNDYIVKIIKFPGPVQG